MMNGGRGGNGGKDGGTPFQVLKPGEVKDRDRIDSCYSKFRVDEKEQRILRAFEPTSDWVVEDTNRCHEAELA